MYKHKSKIIAFTSGADLFIFTFIRIKFTSMVQIEFKNGRYADGETVIYAGNFVILQRKEVVGDKLIITQKPYPLTDIDVIQTKLEAEVRAIPKSELLED